MLEVWSGAESVEVLVSMVQKQWYKARTQSEIMLNLYQTLVNINQRNYRRNSRVTS